MKLLKFVLFVMAMLIGGVYFLAPVSWNEAEAAWMVSSTKVINKPVCEVYDYMGISDRASDWSCFVKKIIPLNANSHADGTIGARRKCLVKDFRPGRSWEEEIIINNTCDRRRLSIEKLHGFPATAQLLYTDQIYRKIDAKNSKLELVVYLQPRTNWDYLKFVFFSPYISGIFSKNLNGIKEQLETPPA